MKATLASIAERARVSIATVDRVLNDRPGVKERTRAAVLHVAHELGYFGPQATGAPTRVRMDFVLPAGQNSFISLLRSHLVEELAARPEIDGHLHQVIGFDENALAEKLVGLCGKSDAVGVVAIDHPIVSEALEKLTASGTRIATLVSDIPRVRSVGYIGIDNRAAGRLAGYLIGRFLPRNQPARVAVLIGSPSYRGHEEREMGVRSILSREFSHLTVSSIHEINDDREKAYSVALDLLRRERPDAIYNIGAGNQGVARALKDTGLAGKVVFIGHDLTSAARSMLLDGTMDAVIDQNARVEAREAVKLLLSAVKGSNEAEYPPRLQVIFRENLP
ncbi:LacI family DNA-binding transcriptional regulator [Tabrizicola oligotrophica]|uniref:LacI family transcriptional regulator n=1 Tax=Tabrizicola oligotrophica TaxID=2710650 RepID=A0A6M0QWH4_9RHOB|nr:LacI family DNA-binding transcriptional regulator [Tabrizicola oligotrophica]NEY91828.1 LacI family transcriptional regulator [Tabrizicola oligotrophica]